MGLSRVVESAGYAEENCGRNQVPWTDSRSGLILNCFLSGGFCSSWDGLVEKCEGSLEFWDAPGGVEKKITEKEKIAEKRR